MADQLPQANRAYQNHTIDSTRWEQFVPRNNDIVIATPYKSGTTWMQTIVHQLIFLEGEASQIFKISPWLDARFWGPVDEVIKVLEAQKHRRFIKTHLPLDGLPYYPQVKYIVVSRDARDVFMSLWNHYRNYTEKAMQLFNDTPGRVGEPLSPCPDDINTFWQQWIGRGWFSWESEGYPFWSNLRHTQTWWDFSYLPNILFVHYNDLLKDLAGQIRRIATYLGIELSEHTLSSITDATTFSTMKQKAAEILPGIEPIFRGGATTFINKGTNGRWKEVLTDEDLQLYDAAVARELSADCAHWLENGSLTTKP